MLTVVALVGRVTPHGLTSDESTRVRVARVPGTVGTSTWRAGGGGVRDTRIVRITYTSDRIPVGYAQRGVSVPCTYGRTELGYFTVNKVQLYAPPMLTAVVRNRLILR